MNKTEQYRLLVKQLCDLCGVNPSAAYSIVANPLEAIVYRYDLNEKGRPHMKEDMTGVAVLKPMTVDFDEDVTTP